MWIDQKDHVSYGIYTPSPGSFAKLWGREPKDGIKDLEYWASCRDIFHRENRCCRRFYFFHNLSEGQGRSISIFVDKVDDLIGLGEGDRCRLGPTNKRSTMWIEPSRWWWGQSIRRSLFTALLRQSLTYRVSLDNFEHSLYNGTYTGNTRAALDRFIAGNNYYWGGAVGWMSAFDPDERDSARPVEIERALRAYPRSRKSAFSGAAAI